jgi:hypothetical protein
VKTPVHSTKVFQSLNHKCQQAIPFALLIVVLPKILSLVFANTWFGLITGNVVQLVHDSTFRDLVTCCATLMCSHRVGPEYHICHADEQILLLSMLLYLPLRRNPRDTFSVNLLCDDG